MVYSTTIDILPYIALSMGAGALSLLTPCVLPMLPLTVSFFFHRKDQYDTNPIVEALLFVTIFVFLFSSLGILFSFLFGATSLYLLATHPWVNLFIGLFIIAFALNLLGLFDIVISPKLVTMFERRTHTQAKYVSIVMLAFVLILTTFTCTMPFIGTVLVTASYGTILYPLIGLFCYSIAFISPFLILSLFPTWMNYLPKSGNWTIHLKFILGIIELAASLKFLSNADMVFQFHFLTRDIILLILSFLCFLLSLYFIRVIYIFLQKSFLPRISKFSLPTSITVVILSGLCGMFLLGSLNKTSIKWIEVLLPPTTYGSHLVSYPESEDIHWLKSISVAKEQSGKLYKPIFIDFTGFTCINCRWMEQNIFSQKMVRDLLKHFVLVRLYTDGQSEQYVVNQRYQADKFHSIALPLYGIISEQEIVIASFLGMSRKKQDFVTFLENSLEKYHLQRDRKK